MAKRIATVEREIIGLKENLQERRFQDSMVMSRIREELDFASNTKKEDKIIITGLTCPTPAPALAEEKKICLKNVVGTELNKIIPDSACHIVFITQGRKNANEIPLVEVKMDSCEVARKIRTEYAAKKKAGTDFGKLFLANSVTLGTRVRVDILRAMAKKFSTEGEELFVIAYTSRPLLQLRRKEAGNRSMAFTFSDAIARYGKNLTEGDLGDAYRRAGVAFRGQLQQNFVVLHERQPYLAPRETNKTWQSKKNNVKRPREEGSQKPEPEKKQKIP